MDDILQEISKGGAQDGVFSQYRDKAEIGKAILLEITGKKYSSSQKSGKGFFIAENERTKIGTISQCLGLETIALIKNFDVDVLGEDGSDRITGIVADTVADIFNRLTLNPEKVDKILSGEYKDVTLTNDCTPFLDNGDISEDDAKKLRVIDYVDTMAKVLETFCEFRGFYIKASKRGIKLNIDGYKDLIDAIDAVIAKSMYDINVAALKLKEPRPYFIGGEEKPDDYGQKMIFKGWGYCNMEGQKAEPSMYYTYAVSSAYMSFYEAFGKVISACDENKIKSDSHENVSFTEFDLKKYGVHKRDYQFFRRFYNLYTTFNKTVYDAGHYMDTRIREKKLDISKDFIGFGYSKITYDEIANSTTNDAMINVLFAVLIYLYSGTDIDYEAAGKFDEFNDALFYATQNVLRSYQNLTRVNKGYIVDQYVLNFNEEVNEGRYDQVKLLRKQRIYTVSLMPLLISAYTAIAKYLIRYPQKQMKDYLKIILENRCRDKGNNPQWLWDKDGYNVAVNLCYVQALQEFYEYYETYEYPYTKDDDSFDKKLKKLKDEHDETLQELNKKHEEALLDKDQKYNDALEDNKKAYEEKIEKLQQECFELSKLRPLEEQVIELVKKHLKEDRINIFREMLVDAREVSTTEENSEVGQAFKQMFISLFKEQIDEVVRKDVGMTGATEEENKKYAKACGDEMFRIFADRLQADYERKKG